MQIVSFDYLTLLHLHLILVVLSGGGFIARMILRFRSSELLLNRLVRTVPHLVDTALLVSAIALMVTINNYPIRDVWLTVKVCLVLGYILFGVAAYRPATKQLLRMSAFLCAIACYICTFLLGGLHAKGIVLFP